MKVYVHPSAEKHGISEDEVVKLWSLAWRFVPRYSDELLALSNYNNKDYELIAKVVGVDEYLVFHCFTPPTKKFLDEIFRKGY